MGMNTIVRLLSVDEQEHKIQVRDKKKKKKISHDQIDRERKEEAREKEKAVGNLGMYTIKDITFLLVNNSINNSYYWNAYLLHFSFQVSN